MEDYREIGKVVGRKKGDVLLDYVGLSPKKEIVVEEAPEVFDYGELIKYGFSVRYPSIMHEYQCNHLSFFLARSIW